MEFISVQQAANNFGVTVRTVQKWAKEGKLLGAKRVGRVWLIPEDAVIKSENENIGTIASSNEVSCGMPLKLMVTSFTPGSASEVINNIASQKCKIFTMAEYHFLRAEHKECVGILENFLTDNNDNISFPAGFLYAFANLSLNKAIIAKITLNDFKQYLNTNVSKQKITSENATPVFFAIIAGVLLHSEVADVSNIEEVLKFLPEGARLFGAYVVAHYCCINKNYSMAIGVAEGALAVASDFYPVVVIYLKIISAVAYIHLKKIDRAKICFDEALSLAMPDGFIEPFIEHHGLLLGLIETYMREKYPHEYKRVISGVEQFFPHWSSVRDSADGKHITNKLSSTEFIVAMLFDRGWSMKEISSYLGLSLRMVKYYLATVYDKLGISKREELRYYMLK